jgi:hypothetical protein
VEEEEKFSLEDLGALDPEAVMADAHRDRYGEGPDEVLLLALREILASELVEEKSA